MSNQRRVPRAGVEMRAEAGDPRTTERRRRYHLGWGAGAMVQVTEAVFSQGVLRPVGDVHLKEQQRVRLIIEPLEAAGPNDREDALRRLRSGIENMKFRSSGPLPSRDELHDRG
jgi:predicted DNA-binding antitoxin AbrB/MazE fold protein